MPLGDWQDVESSNMKRVRYNHDERTMDIQFHGGAIYRYHGVSVDHHADLMGASSHGEHFASNIKGQFNHTRIPSE